MIKAESVEVLVRIYMELDQWSKKDTKTSNKTILYSDICLEKKRQPNPHFFLPFATPKETRLAGKVGVQVKKLYRKNNNRQKSPISRLLVAS